MAARTWSTAGGRRTLAAVALAAALLTVALRAPGALHGALWADEVASARVLAEPGPRSALAQVERTESTPPGWYLLAWTAHRAGVPIADVRLLSAAFAGGLAALLVLYARALLSLPAAGLAGLLAALDWELAYHGRELRAYALLALVASAYGFALQRAARAPTRGRCAVLAATVLLGAFTHYFFLFTVASGLFWIWTARALRPVRLRLTAVTLVPLTMLLAWAGPFLTQFRRGNYAWIGEFDALKLGAFFSTVFDGAGWIYGRQRSMALDGGFAWRLAIAMLVLYGATVLARRSLEGRLCAMLAAGPVALAALAWLAGLPIFDSRNLIGTVPFVLVATVAAVASLPPRAALTAAIAVVAALVALFPVQPLGPPADRISAALARDGWRPKDPIALLGRADSYLLPLSWYLPGRPELALEPVTRHLACRDTYLLAPGSDRLPGLNRAPAVRVGGEAIVRLANDTRLCTRTLPLAQLLVAQSGSAGAGRRRPV
jgi:hypothetical protein